jgi:hypothetical protein
MGYQAANKQATTSQESLQVDGYRGAGTDSYSHRAHLQTHTEKGPEPSAGTHTAQENRQLDSLDSYLWRCLGAGPIHTSYQTEWKPFSLSS